MCVWIFVSYPCDCHLVSHCVVQNCIGFFFFRTTIKQRAWSSTVALDTPILCVGYCHLLFPKSGNHYTWEKMETTVHNIIVGQVWLDHHGEKTIVNHHTGDTCQLVFHSYSYIYRDNNRKVGTAQQVEIGQIVERQEKSGNHNHKLLKCCLKQSSIVTCLFIM